MNTVNQFSKNNKVGLAFEKDCSIFWRARLYPSGEKITMKYGTQKGSRSMLLVDGGKR